MGETGRSERGRGSGVPMIWVCGVRSVNETGERMEQQQSSPLARRSWRAWEMSMGEGGLRRELFVVISPL